MDDITKEFLVESREGLEQLDLDLVALERQPDDSEVLARVFRAVHSIKGACGFLGYQRLESVAHVGETLLGHLRDGSLLLSEAIATALLSLLDAFREMLDCIESTGSDGDRAYEELIAVLEACQSGATDSSDVESGSAGGAPPVSGLFDDAANESVSQPAEPPAPEPPPSESVPDRTVAEENAAEPKAENPSGSEDPTASADKDRAAAGRKPGKANVSDTTVRVNVGLLDELMNQVGELVLARNQIVQCSQTIDDPNFLATTQRLNLITSELQEGVMKTRMQPIGTIWNKLPRVVRDLSRMVGKRVRIEMEGEDTELDRTIIEAIKDPLTHVVRNSVDHGLESPEDRKAIGKDEEGCLRLRAFHEGGQVNLEITDDGAGINTEKVRQKAIERGILRPEDAANLSERESLHLIFSPGFSTAAAITNISGRGVGMDVVKTNIERIGGAVDVQSQVGVGTTLRIKIPLTLAIVPALIVQSAGAPFAIPQLSLLELVRFEGRNAATAIEWIHDVPVHRLRGNLLPLIWLDEQLGLVTREQAARRRTETLDEDDDLNIAVLQADDLPFGLVVDAVCDNQEIVVKPLGRLLEQLACYAGATIMGDGHVALILDAVGLAVNARLESASGEIARAVAAQAASEERRDETESLLLFHIGENDRFGVALSDVARLEEFAPDVIEFADDQPVVQYRGAIMPLVDLGIVFGRTTRRTEKQPWQVLVRELEGEAVGMVIGGIIDVVESTVDLELRVRRAGLRGSAIVQGKVTEILDAGTIIANAGLTETGVA